MDYRSWILERIFSSWRDHISPGSVGFGYFRKAPQAILFSTDFKRALGWLDDTDIQIIVDGNPESRKADSVLIRRISKEEYEATPRSELFRGGL